MKLEFGDLVEYNSQKYTIIGETVDGCFRLKHVDNGLTIEVDKSEVSYVCDCHAKL